MGSEFTIRNTAEEIRTYVKTGGGNNGAKLSLNEEYLTGCAQGPHQHSVVIAGRKDKRRIDAIVRLFGALCYFVTLTEQYDGADFYNTFVHDVQRGNTDGVLVGHLQSEFRQIEHVTTSKETIWSDGAVPGTRLMKFISDEIEAKLRQPRL